MKLFKKILYLTLLSSSVMISAQVKIGDNPTSIGTSSALELESTNKALLVTRVANTSAITNPVNGMVIYDMSSNCIKSYENGAWTNCLSNGSNIESSSNGTAVVASYTCNTASTGNLTAGQLVSGVTQTITANVTSIGSYTITAISNGVIFTGSGFFAATGNQDVILSATGTPINSGSANFVLNTTPGCSFTRNVLTNPSTNGTAVVTTYSCSTASAGTMTESATVSGVTQTITATVTTIGTYNISTTANGVTFAGSGTFTATGPQTIVLTATGAPTSAAASPYTYTLNTTPNCSFTRAVLYKSTNGTANVTAYNCSGASNGTMTVGTAVSGVTQVITATVATAGTYNITTTTANGVTFAASGTFAGTGSQNITLTATGTPTTAGTNTFTLNTTPNCSFTRSTGETFTSTVCSTSIGTYPNTVTVGSSSVTVTKTTSTDGGSSGAIAQCGISPSGNILSFSSGQSATYTFSIPLKNVQIYGLNNENTENNEGLTVTASLAGVSVPVQLTPFGGTCLASFTTSQSGNAASFQNTVSASAQAAIFNVSASGPYDQLIVTRTSTASGNNNHGLMFCNATAVPNTTSGGSAVVSAYNCSGTSSGTMTQGTAVSGVTQTITATVTTAGGYNITATANGVTFTGSGTFAGTGSQTITLTATGTPSAAGTHTFALSTTPSCSFTRSTGQTFTSTVCSTSVGTYPTTTTIGSTSVTINKTTSTDNGSIAAVSQCGISPSGNILSFGSGQSATYTFSVPLKNVQVYGLNNESNENNEGFTVTASLAGVSIPVQLVPFGGSCTANFTATQSGNAASINNTTTTSTVGLVFNISSNTEYDTITISRVVASGGNNHGLMFCNATAVPSSSNGTAVVSSYNCSTASAGTLQINSAVSGVTQTITANVTTPGTYLIATNPVNGVTFSASGTFASAGAQTVVLTASGTPVATGTNTFTLNTNPSCSFTRTTVNNLSSNGTADVSAYSCSGASVGTMTVGTAVSGVTQVITATVTTVGTYNISTTANGVTFAASGTFAGTGSQSITLTATGTPTAAGTNSFTLNTTPNCSFTRSTGNTFVNTACTTGYGTYPQTLTIGGSSVTIAKTTSTDSGSTAINSQCGITITGNGLSFGSGQSATYTFTSSINNVQVYGFNNEVAENNEGFTVTATKAGVSVPIQLVPTTAGTCNASFTTSQSGNTASINDTNGTGTQGLIFNISSSTGYDRIIITRVVASGNNGHSLLFCNAVLAP